jgi:L-lactate dehydrogenase
MAIALRARARDLILIDRDLARTKGAAIDMHYGVPLSPLVRIAAGDYEDLAGAHLAIIAAGVNEKAGAPPTATIRAGGCGCWRPT